MNNTVLLVAASIVALSAAMASANDLPTSAFSDTYHPSRVPKGVRTLYDQNSNYADEGISSQNFTSGNYSTYDDQAADDFVVPKGQTWDITEVDVSGATSTGGTPTSEDVIFYTDENNMPGKPVRKGTFDGVNGTFSSGNIAIKLPKEGRKLKPGTYWVSVIVNMNFEEDGQWYWNVNSVQHGNQAMWRYPGQWEPCPTWGTIEECLNAAGPDLMFALRGTSQRK